MQLDPTRHMRDRCRWLLLEAGVALAVSAAFVWVCTGPRFGVFERAGQVSALSFVELRLAYFAIALVAGLIVAAKVRAGVHFELVSRLVCAAVAGLASAAIAGGLVVVLRGTPYGLGGQIGDSAVLAGWARDVQAGKDVPALYPPLQVHLVAWLADLYGTSTAYAIKPFQILGVMLVGPAAYTSWRLVLRPGWALGVGVVAALPFIDLYRPYPFLSLVIFVPVAIRFLQILRRSPDLTLGALLRSGVASGLALGVLALLYSGWLMWSFGGFAVAAAIVFPWRRGWRSGAVLVVAAGIAFAAVTARYFIGVLDTLPVRDDFMYFDSRVEPAYIAMWRGDMPGVVEELSLWPPIGELAGVGVFTLLLVVGIGLAIAYGRHRTVVIGVGAMLVGVWLLRFWHAHRMWKTKLVQLYPRTTAELLYGSLILCGFAVYFLVERARRRAPADSPLRTSSGMIGAVTALLLLLAFSTSPTLDRFMPKEAPRDIGNLSWLAHKTPLEGEDNIVVGATVEVSSTIEDDGWTKQQLIDRSHFTGYTSKLHDVEDREEWVVLRFPERIQFSRILLQASAGGFPVDFTIDVWDGVNWLPRLVRRGYMVTYGPELFSWNKVERTDRVRIRATKLGPIPSIRTLGGGYALRFAEIELYR